MKAIKNLIIRIKSFLMICCIAIILFIGIFIPPTHKAINEGALETMRKLVKKYDNVEVKK